MFARSVKIFVRTSCLGLLLTQAVPGRGQTVNFADTNLESVVREAISKPTGPITAADLQPLTYLYAFDHSIRDLSGLEYATNLTDLYLDYNQVQNFASLEKMPQLKTLSLFQNHLSDLKFLRHLTNLDVVGVGGNVIWDFSPLFTLTNVNTLTLDYSGLTDISFLGKMPWLSVVSVYANPLEDVSPLLAVTNLTDLDVSDMPVTNLAALGGLPKLVYLTVGDVSMTSLNWLSGLPKLPNLTLRDSSVSNFAPLLQLTNLTSFSLQENGPADLSVLAQLTNLNTLDISGPNVTNLPFSVAMPRLRDLGLMYSGVADLTPITNLTRLSTLYARYARISNIDCLPGLTNLFLADVSGNLLDTNAGSPAMGVISNLETNGVYVSYSPQKAPPACYNRTNWNIPNDRPSFIRLSASSDSPFQPLPILTIDPPNPALISSASVLPLSGPPNRSRLNVVPITNQTGATVLHLIATDEIGLRSTQDIQLTVSAPLPFPAQVLNASNLTWTTAGSTPWFSQTTNTHDGVGAAQSGSSDSWLATKVTGPGTISFWFATLPRQDLYNGGSVSICRADGAFPGVIPLSSGPCWQQISIPIPLGTWLLRWDPLASDFVSDYFNPPPNTLWLDQVTYTAGGAGSILEIDPYLSFAGRYIHLYGEPGSTTVLETSSDLHTWSPFSTQQFTEFDTWEIDPSWRLPQRYYRLHRIGP